MSSAICFNSDQPKICFSFDRSIFAAELEEPKIDISCKGLRQRVFLECFVNKNPG